MTKTAAIPTSPAPFADDDSRAVFARAVALASAVIGRVGPDQLALATPTDMNVRELMEHLVMVLRRVACAGRGEEPASWPVDAPDADGRWSEAWREAAHDVQAAWTDDALLTRPTTLPWGTFTGTEALDIYTNEVTVHTWDLAQVTGQAPEWDPTVLAVADAAIHSQLPLADRTPIWEAVKASLPPGIDWEDPFGNAIDVPDDAASIDRLVAWNGRQP